MLLNISLVYWSKTSVNYKWFQKAEFAHWDFCFENTQNIVDLKNIKGVITSHWKQSKREGSWEKKL